MVCPEKDWLELELMLATHKLLNRYEEEPRSLPKSVLGRIEVPFPRETLPPKTAKPFTVKELSRVAAPVTLRVPPKILFPTTCNLLEGAVVPTPTLSVEVVRKILVPECVQPAAMEGSFGVIVNFLFVASVVRVMPAPVAKVSVSVLLPATMSL